jgi:hypothetical protein
MTYYLCMVTADGAIGNHAKPFSTLEAAMSVACPAIGNGLADAWIEDHNGERRADFDDIKKHCGVSQAPNF